MNAEEIAPRGSLKSRLPGLRMILMPVGSGTISDGSGSSRFSDFRDGLSTTIAVAELFPTDIYWNEPRDLPLDRMSHRLNDPSKPSISSPHTDGAIALFADGHTQTLSNAVDPKVLKALLTVRGGGILDLARLNAPRLSQAAQ